MRFVGTDRHRIGVMMRTAITPWRHNLPIAQNRMTQTELVDEAVLE